jgi:5-methylcytosine-specific restriction endonuclease McrA
VVLRDGTDVRLVSHPGRFVGARLRTAVEEQFPECGIAGCHCTERLEIDHNLPVERGGPTALWNLDRLCRHHHRYKHEHDLRLEGRGTDLRFVAAEAWSPPGPDP